MSPLGLVILFCSLASALVVPRAAVQDVPEGNCCFTLHDGAADTIVRQDKRTGILYLGGTRNNGWYCIEGDILRDDFNNACFLNPDGQFKCLDPINGPNKWTLQKAGGGAFNLVHDGDSAFSSCPNDAGEQLLYGKGEMGASGCKKLTLKADGLQGACQNFSS